MPLPGAKYWYKIMKKNLCKFRVQSCHSETYSKCSVIIAVCDAENLPIGVICPCSRMYKIMQEIYIESEFKAVFLKLAVNDQSSKTSFVA